MLLSHISILKEKLSIALGVKVVLTMLAIFILPRVLADDHYAAQNDQTPASPYDTASNIQDAVNADHERHDGLGRHRTLYRARQFHELHRQNVVYINYVLTLRSSNSVPADTIIDGGGSRDN